MQDGLPTAYSYCESGPDWPLLLSGSHASRLLMAGPNMSAGGQSIMHVILPAVADCFRKPVSACRGTGEGVRPSAAAVSERVPPWEDFW